MKLAQRLTGWKNFCIVYIILNLSCCQNNNLHSDEDSDTFYRVQVEYNDAGCEDAVAFPVIPINIDRQIYLRRKIIQGLYCKIFSSTVPSVPNQKELCNVLLSLVDLTSHLAGFIYIQGLQRDTRQQTAALLRLELIR